MRRYVQSYRFSLIASAATICGLISGAASAQSWTPLANAPGFNAAAAQLLTDGTVIVQAYNSGVWKKLTPDNTGSYVNGTWTSIASMPSGYNPLYYGSAVLPDGRVIANGGEYNGGNNGVWTTKGAIYDPVANTWTNVNPPTGWTTIGDAQTAILVDGTYMLANCCTTDEALLNLATMKWTATGTGKADRNDEEGWTLLPSGQLLTVDSENGTNTEIYTNGTWKSAGNTPSSLIDSGAEQGPDILLPTDKVLAVGATGVTAIYDVKAGTWSAGPSFPSKAGVPYDEADGPGVLLPSGDVLLAASPGEYKKPVQFFEFTGKKLKKIINTPNAKKDSSFYVHLLLLPTGQVLQTDFSNNVEIFNPAGSPKAAWAPTITSFPSKVTHGSSYTLTGTLLNGMSQAVAYGDDYQGATNYPLVRITNTASGHVTYARTTNPSSMAVANTSPSTVSVAIPSGIETGASTLVVVANGIASKSMNVTVN